MNYSIHYTNLIERAKTRISPDVFEKHHIVPRCLGGNDDISNIVNLTPEEHYIAHQLLVKIQPHNPKLVFAASMMVPANPFQSHRKNKLYGWLRRKLIEANKSRPRENHSQLGTMWINDGTINRKVKKTVPLEPGWVKGRLFNKSFSGFSYINTLPSQGHEPGQNAAAAKQAGLEHGRKMKSDPEYRANWISKHSKTLI
jgi:hypothetical protein